LEKPVLVHWEEKKGVAVAIVSGHSSLTLVDKALLADSNWIVKRWSDAMDALEVPEERPIFIKSDKDWLFSANYSFSDR
ncbi:MAG: hypothetical protein ACKO1U_08475, partial [Bacteroidota bacterium]